MIRTFKLIEPNEDIISIFNSFWRWQENPKSADPSFWMVSLFQNEPVINIADEKIPIIEKNVFAKWSDDDKTIERFAEEKNLSEMIKKIDTIYHPLIYKKLDSSKVDALIGGLDWNSFKSAGLTAFVERSKTVVGEYAYSFATKIFSFMGRAEKNDNYPILDSYVVTLMDYYLKNGGDKVDKSKLKKCNRSTWGDYNSFKEAYDLFRSSYKLNESGQNGYKEIDTFLWTYGKAIQNYWRKCGILNFSSVQYSPEKTES